MHTRTDELRAHLDRTRQLLADALSLVPTARRDTRPESGGWSVADVLSHLGKIELQVVELLRRKLQRATAAGPLPAIAAGDGDWQQLADRLLDRGTRIEAPAFVAPEPEQGADAAWRSLRDSREALVDLLTDVDGRDTTAIRAPHAFLGRLTFEQWIAFVGFHEQRHAMQIEELA